MTGTSINSVQGKSKNNPTSPEAAQGKTSVALKEEEILKFWKENKIFEKSLEKEAPKGEFIFYDGPPFATGLPHYGSLLSSVGKDLIPRYKTMRGFRVRRRWGWDCHGLPIESIVEKKLGLKHKKDIEILGIEKFNEECRAQVLTYALDWKKYIDRIGRWVDFDNSYKTMDTSYTESVWWALSQIHKRGMLYEGRKVLLCCPRCETPLSRAEIAMDNSYQDITEEAVTIKFKVKEPGENNLPKNTFLLAWTTTPWTLPANVALAVGPDIDYVIIKKENKETDEKPIHFILAENRLKPVWGNDKYEVVKKTKGKNLINLEYEPLYDLPAVRATGKKAWFVAPADFVTTEDGTGIVHTAVIYGEEDYQLGLKINLPMVPLILSNGNFNNDAPKFIRGIYIKEAENLIKKDLEKRKLLFAKALNTHSYPHCYRCGTPLIYNALSSWFVDIQKIKKKMLSKNENINWVPEHLKHGRFQDIVENAPDWNISRNRFWASPLPIWKNEKTGRMKIIGSIEELKKYTKKSGNKYFTMRHGEAEQNVSDTINSNIKNIFHLTEEGEKQVRIAVGDIKKEKINLIIASPFERCKETAKIAAEVLDLSKDSIVSDERIMELQTGLFEGKTCDEYSGFFNNTKERFYKAPDGGETLLDVSRRVGEFLYDLEKKYPNRNILIISHESPITAMHTVAEGADLERSIEIREKKIYKSKLAELLKLDFTPLPHNKNYGLDLHRPYIDEIELTDKDGSVLKRITEVIDCWVESGSMPFAEYNYPYSNKDTFEKRTPGDFVVEYIPQTRTWFYYMHALSVALFGHEPFKNVLTTGTILAANGSKMSKSKGNYTDPLALMDRYGADALRYYMMTSVVMQAEDLNFKDDEVREVYQRMINILLNVVTFYNTYKTDFLGTNKTENILDKWIISRLKELHTEVTENLERYDTVKAGRPIRNFIEDLSTWYLRRSRDRFKSENMEERRAASETTHFILLELSKIIAPYMPFLAEGIYQSLKSESNKISVHLEDWPDLKNLKIDENLINSMEKTREIVSLALERRMSAGIKVRQPLQKIQISKSEFKNFEEEYLELIKDEVNVKEVIFDENLEKKVKLDTKITEELQKEGNIRDLIRAIQEFRKNKNLVPNDEIKIIVDTSDEGKRFLNSISDKIKNLANVSEIKFESNNGSKLEIGSMIFVISLL